MEAPRTVERNQRGRKATEIEMPTPPRSGQATHWPTPDSVRRPSKRPIGKIQPVVQIQAIPPTPETLPRPPRKSMDRATDGEGLRPLSPSGHTTFFQATSSSGPLDEKISTRRPGLTFAQQMGLLSNTSSAHASRTGAGVGMGGSRHGMPKKDQIMAGRLAEAVALSDPADDNPFITQSTRKALYSPGGSDFTSTLNKGSEPTCIVNAHGLRTPPATRHKKSARIAVHDDATEARRLEEAERVQNRKEEARKRKEAEERKRKQKEMMQMMDVESNPFLAKPGESSRTRQRLPLPVDESRPTVTYVFRGSRKVFANPFYPSEAAYPPADLDPEDEDYELHPNPKPRLLFPSPPAPEKRFKLEDFDTPPASREISPPSSPMMATPRRRLFANEIALVAGADKGSVSKGGYHDEEEDEEDDEDEDGDDVMSDSPVRRRLFQPVKDLKRPATEAAIQLREEKRARLLRM